MVVSLFLERVALYVVAASVYPWEKVSFGSFCSAVLIPRTTFGPVLK